MASPKAVIASQPLQPNYLSPGSSWDELISAD